MLVVWFLVTHMIISIIQSMQVLFVCVCVFVKL